MMKYLRCDKALPKYDPKFMWKYSYSYKKPDKKDIELELKEKKKRKIQQKQQELQNLPLDQPISPKKLVNTSDRSFNFQENWENKPPILPDVVYLAPEQYEFQNFRAAYNKQKMDVQKSEVFQLGMIILSAAVLEDMSEAYGPFQMNKEYIEQKLNVVYERYGLNLITVLKKMLEFDTSIRPNAEQVLSILNSLNDEDKDQMGSNQNGAKLGHIKKFSLQDDIEEENALQKKIISTIPQEYQAEIDNMVNQQLLEIEEKYSIEMFIEGHRYQGEKNMKNLPHGWGIFWWSNGERYEGQFSFGRQHGKGIYYWPTGLKHYGEFFRGDIQGLGVRYYPDGSIYFGEWLGGKTHGYGTYFWPNGERYSGGFIEDLIYGKGTLIWPEVGGKTVKRYEGLWKDDGVRGLKVEQMSQNLKDNRKQIKFVS